MADENSVPQKPADKLGAQPDIKSDILDFVSLILQVGNPLYLHSRE